MASVTATSDSNKEFDAAEFSQGKDIASVISPIM